MGEVAILLDLVVEGSVKNLPKTAIVKLGRSLLTCMRARMLPKLSSIWLPVGKFLDRDDENLLISQLIVAVEKL